MHIRSDLSVLRGAPQFKLAALMLMLAAAGPIAAQNEVAASSPCLQELGKQKADAGAAEPKQAKAPSWFSRNAEKLMGGAGAVGGALLGKAACKDANRANCMSIGALGGALLGSQLGKALSEADKKRYQEATYKVALTGRPQSLTLEKGCMVVEATSSETFEDRQVELALGPGVALPQKLRSVAEPYVRKTPTTLGPAPTAAKGGANVAANVPSFVMGSTDSGKYLLLGREDADQGFVGAGYVDAQGWVASPDSTPAPMESAAGQPKIVKVGVEVPCRQISSSIRVEASNKTETYPGKVCRLPNGISESV